MPIPDGARVTVTMFMHPIVTLFMVFWLSFIGFGVLTEYRRHSTDVFMLIAMFLFGFTLPLVVFFLEVSKAKLLLRDALSHDQGRTF